MPAGLDAPTGLWTDYQPSLLAQDWVTLPAEIALTYAVSTYYPISEKPLWPYDDERNDATRNASRHPGNFAVPLMGAMSLPVFAYNMQTNSYFSAWGFARGWIHAHLLTEIATSTTKRTFARHRPFYDTEKRADRLRDDDSLSFFSGHSSHAFCAATYLAGMANLGDAPAAWRWGTSALLFAGATWVAWGRVEDNQHHWDDVAVGALAGTTISGLVFARVRDVQSKDGAPGDKDDALLNSQASLFFYKDYLGVKYSLKL